MATTAQGVCRIKSNLFSTCGDGAIACCQYCGRDFCARHGVILADAQEVCSRKECVAKREDLALHLLYKEAVGHLNEQGLCGAPTCREEIAAQCVRCKGLFCGVHVRKREESFVYNQVKDHRMATLCRHCVDRRSIWTRQ